MVVTLLAAAVLCPPAARPADPANPAAEPRSIAGRYHLRTGAAGTITLKPLSPGVYSALADEWEGAGLFDGASYWGVFRIRRPAKGPAATGTHRGTLLPDGSLGVHGEFAGGPGMPFDVVWVPEREGAPSPQPGLPVPTFEHPVWPREAPPDAERLPGFGEYVRIDELPEALTKVPPVYPDAARKAKVEGTVLVQALVGADGRVKDTRIAGSVPGLDEAAAEAVRQWVFKPATASGKPVAVWVAVPIRFSLR